MQLTVAAHVQRAAPLGRVLRETRLAPWPAVALACLLVGAFLKWPEAVATPGSDTGIFATYGSRVLHGGRPYVDFWDLHPPLVFAYWALVQATTGGVWPLTGLMAHAVDLLGSVVAALVVSGIVRRCGGSTRAAAVAAILVVAFADQVMLSQEGSNPSKLALVPSSLAVLAYVVSLKADRGWVWALMAGAAAALAGFAKQPALLTLVALAGHAIWSRDRRRLSGLLLGGLGVSVVACGVLAAIGSLEGFVAQAWVYNVERTLTGYFVHPAKVPVIGLGRVLAESAGSLAALALVGGVLIAREPGQRVILWWALVNVIAVTAFREFVYVVPSFAAVAALGVDRLWTWSCFRNVSLVRAVLVLACTASIALTTSFQRGQIARARFEGELPAGQLDTVMLGDALRGRLPDGSLFVYGNGAQLYPLSGRVPATPYLNAEPLRQSAPGVENTRADLVSRLRSSPPEVIALAPHSDEPELTLADYPAMRAFLEACYEVEPELSTSWTILVRQQTTCQH